MKKNNCYLLLLLSLLTPALLYSQGLSNLTVKYMVSYDSDKKVYTAWIVPNYDTPNVNNADTQEKGATAQFTLKVPRGFAINQIQDIRGNWDKAPVKLGTEDVFKKAGIASDYYIIGKSPSETNYGAFRSGEPVALFTFKGSEEGLSEVKSMDSDDPFISVANEKLSLNVGNSFYSRSGQKPVSHAFPMEQFSSTTSLKSALLNMSKKVGFDLGGNVEGGLTGDYQLINYPNPAVDESTVKYFLGFDEVVSTLELIDVTGKILQTIDWKTKRGVNTILLSTSKVPAGNYKIRLANRYEVISKALVVKK